MLFPDISAQRLMTLAQVLPAGPLRLLALLLELSKGGRHKVYATEAWCVAQLDISESTYHRWRRALERLGLVRIMRRKIDRYRNLPNLVSVMPLADLARWAWAKMKAGISRMCVKGVRYGTQTLSINKNSCLARFMPEVMSLPDTPMTPARVEWLRKQGRLLNPYE